MVFLSFEIFTMVCLKQIKLFARFGQISLRNWRGYKSRANADDGHCANY